MPVKAICATSDVNVAKRSRWSRVTIRHNISVSAARTYAKNVGLIVLNARVPVVKRVYRWMTIIDVIKDVKHEN